MVLFLCGSVGVLKCFGILIIFFVFYFNSFIKLLRHYFLTSLLFFFTPSLYPSFWFPCSLLTSVYLSYTPIIPFSTNYLLNSFLVDLYIYPAPFLNATSKTKRVVLLSDIVDFPSHFDKKFNFRSMNTSPTLLNGDEFEFDSSCCSSVMSPASFQTSSEVASILNQPIKNIELTENPYNEELKGILTRRNHPDLPTP